MHKQVVIQNDISLEVHGVFSLRLVTLGTYFYKIMFSERVLSAQLKPLEVDWMTKRKKYVM